jgi:ammonia channel protein AmtB
MAVLKVTTQVIKNTLDPPKGSRKTRMALLVMLLFLTINIWAIIRYSVPAVEVLKLNADFMWKVLLVFVAGNGVEHISSGFGGKENLNDNDQK